MGNVAREDTQRDIDPDSAIDLGDIERIDVAPDYRAELSVPVRSEQLSALELLGREREVTAAQAAQYLIERGLAESDASHA